VVATSLAIAIRRRLTKGVVARLLVPCLIAAAATSLAAAAGSSGVVGGTERGAAPRFESARCPSFQGRPFKRVYPELARAHCG
jgi:hypothetical protein